ncbi:hypothetical protein EHS25_005814 [Saitozyma podzolica]|uniref:Enoyl reductase (ER) domain-containing protein n=1 Tax=Saitozyma podzolica TaxID=1890683 RepID=A0A427XVE3_9TREE|nr:hypothetical protein EHS25_005814 [Saitozyma podzolica]
MRGVVLKGAFNVKVERRPVPRVEKDTDAVMRVHLAGLCGGSSGLPGENGSDAGFIMGHEAVGEVVEVGKGVGKFKVGDKVFSPFHLSCGDCFYCHRGYFSRCVQAQCIGGPGIEGAQAEYLRVPLADATLLPTPADMPEELMLLMADILPTGYSVAWHARRLADEDRESLGADGGLSGAQEKRKGGVCVVVGCGPVGLCAITSALTLFSKVFATDLQPTRLRLAEKHGAIALPLEQLRAALLEATDGRGADAVLEVVGHPGALTTSMDLVRPFGVISSCGVHSMPITMDGDLLYSKNLRFQFGRCSVRKFYPMALEILKANIPLFEGFVEHRIALDDAEEYYRLFEQNKVAKTIFVMKE